MSSARERILGTMVMLLNAAYTANGNQPLPTVRQRPRPIAVENPDGTSGIDALLLYALKEDSERESTNRVRRTCHLRIEIPVAGPPPLDQAADPLYLFVIGVLFSQETIDTLSQEDGVAKVFWHEEVGLIWETVSTYEDASVCALELKFVYVTTTDPSVRV